LSRILPSAYEIGRGEIIDSSGKRSKQIDVVISRPDSPSLLLPSGSKVYLIESVLATIEVKSELTGGAEGTLLEALENCASVADLTPQFIKPSVQEFFESKGIQKGEDGVPIFRDPLQQQQFTVYGYPASYIFGFKGYSQNIDDFANAILNWGNNRIKLDKQLLMRHIPAVIASAGCIAFRNADPFLLSDEANRYECLAMAGTDPTPLRMLIAHLLYTLYTKIPWTPDENKLKPNPFVYLQQMKAYDYQRTLFCLKPPEGKDIIELQVDDSPDADGS